MLSYNHIGINTMNQFHCVLLSTLKTTSIKNIRQIKPVHKALCNAAILFSISCTTYFLYHYNEKVFFTNFQLKSSSNFTVFWNYFYFCLVRKKWCGFQNHINSQFFRENAMIISTSVSKQTVISALWICVKIWICFRKWTKNSFKLFKMTIDFFSDLHKNYSETASKWTLDSSGLNFEVQHELLENIDLIGVMEMVSKIPIY